MARNRITFGIKLGLTRAQAAALACLHTPAAIQMFINKMPINFETGGETHLSVAESLRQRQAHCLEGACVAACALWINGFPPLLMNLRAQDDDDHAVALFRIGRRWGAISKSNHLWLRWREPVYLSLRELTMSYYHEYVSGPRRTLAAYSAPLDLRRFDPAVWVGNRADKWDVPYALAKTRHFRLVPRGFRPLFSQSDPIERRANELVDFKPPGRRKRR